MSVAARVAEEMGFKLGNEVGTVIFMISCFIVDKYSCMYCYSTSLCFFLADYTTII